MTDRSKTVVMLIDWDNLQICHSRDAPGTELDLQALIALAQSYGTLVSARAYAEWNLLTERLAVYKAGIEPVFAPVMRPEGSLREGKSLADTVMVADGVDLLWTVAPDVFVLVTSDKDMIPLARIAKQRGAAVVVLGSDLTAIPLVEVSNVFITYRQLLRELDRVGELEAPMGRAPARERRLRESRRPSTEPYASGFGSGGRSHGRPMGGVGGPLPTTPSFAPAPPTSSRRPLEGGISGDRDRVLAPAAEEVPPAIGLPPGPRPEPVGIGVPEVAPRRRRRRGGRGRRGTEGDGDGDGETGIEPREALTADDADRTGEALAARDNADANVMIAVAEAPGANPDEIDSAVLQFLASRDRGPALPEIAPASSGAAASDADAEPVTAPPDPTPPPPAPTPPVSTRRRAVRTSFSSFEPGEVRIRPRSSASTPPTRAVPSAEPPPADASPEPEVTTPPAVEAAPEGIVIGAGAPALPDLADASAAPRAIAPPSGTQQAATAPAADAEAPAAGVADAPSEAGPAPAGVAGDAEPPAPPAEDGPRPVRRRRTRRPTKASADAAAADGGSAPAAGAEGA